MKKAFLFVILITLSFSTLKLHSSECSFEQVYLNPFTPLRTADVYLKSNSRLSLNEQGLAVFDYGAAYGNAGKVVNPMFMATYGLSLFEDHILEPSIERLDGLRIQTDYLISAAKEREFSGVKFYVWPYPFPYEKFEAKAGWISALAHGRILSLFSQMHKLTGDSKYLEAAHLTFNSMIVPMSEGGVATYTPSGLWLEEIADTDLKSIKILNGQISAIAGVWTYAQNTCNSEAMLLTDKAIQAVVNDIKFFDLGFISLYSVEPQDKPIYAPAGGYNHFHIRQLSWIYELSKSSEVLDVAMNIAFYDEPRFTFTAKSSLDTKPPSNLTFKRKSSYWATRELGTWLNVDMHKNRKVDKVFLLANGEEAKFYPNELRVEYASSDMVWQEVENYSKNQQFDLTTISFNEVEAQHVRIYIDSVHGGNEVRLDGVFVNTNPKPVRAISSWFDVYQKWNRPEYLFSHYWGTLADGWFVADIGDFPIIDNKLTLVYQPNKVEPGELFVSIGDSLDTLTTVEVTPIKVGKSYEYNIPIKSQQYMKLEFSGFTKGYALRIKCIMEETCKR